jgi:putative mRNA 3-end processing factor
VLYAYALGKAQRVLHGLDPTIGPILVHGAVDRFLPIYRQAGVDLPATEHATAASAKAGRGRAMVLAPPSAAGTPWLKKFGPVSTAMASGWMQIRGTRRRRAMDRGFALSDHADWDGLQSVIRETGAEQVWVTHGYTSVMVRSLAEQGFNARAIPTRFEGEIDEPAEAAVDDAGNETVSPIAEE